MKVKRLLTVFALIIAVWTTMTLTDKGSEAIDQENSISDPLDQEQGVSISTVRFYFKGNTNILKTGDIRILTNLKELQDFFVELGSGGVKEANKVAEVIDFSREVFIVVASQPMDTCKDAAISALERMREGRLKVTVQETTLEPCEPKPLPYHKPYLVIGTPIERPVNKVDVVYTSRIIESHYLKGK